MRASKTLADNFQICMAAVTKHGDALRFASKRLKNNKKIVLAAVQQEARALQHASTKMKNDREVVLAAMESDPVAFSYASPTLRNNQEICTIAVQKLAWLIMYVSDGMKKNKTVCLAAVSNNAFSSYCYVSDDIYADEDICLAAIRNSCRSIIDGIPQTANDFRSVLSLVPEFVRYSKRVCWELMKLHDETHPVLRFLPPHILGVLLLKKYVHARLSLQRARVGSEYGLPDEMVEAICKHVYPIKNTKKSFEWWFDVEEACAQICSKHGDK